MSFWDGETRTYTAVNVIPLVDQSSNKVMASAIVEAIMNDYDPVDGIMLALRNGLHQNVIKMHDYAKTTYIRGLPKLYSNSQDLKSVEINAILNPTQLVWVKKLLALGYPPPLLQWRYEMQKMYPNFDSLSLYLDYTQTAADAPKVQEVYVYDPDSGIAPCDIKVVTYSDIDTLQDPIPKVEHCITVIKPKREVYRYGLYQNILTGQNAVFIYDASTNAIPSLKLEKEKPISLEFLPIIRIISNFAKLNNPSTEYTQVDKMLSMIGLNLDTLYKELDKNPEGSLVKYAFVFFGADIFSTNQNIIRYHYESFKSLQLANTSTQFTKIKYNPYTQNIVDERIEYIHAVNVNDNYFNFYMLWESIEDTVQTGSIGPVGTYARYFTYGSLVDNIWADLAFDADTKSINFNKNTGIVDFCLQTSSTSYRRIRVRGLTIVHRINITNGLDDQFVYGYISSDPERRKNMVVPVVRKYIDESYWRNNENFIFDTVKLCVYAQQTITVAWYKSSSFLNFISFAFKALALYSFMSGFTAALSKLATAASESVLQSVLIDLATDYALDIAISQSIYAITKKSGVLAGVASFALAVYGINAGGIRNSGFYIKDLNLAEKLLFSVSNVLSIEEVRLSRETQKIQSEIETESAELSRITNELSDKEAEYLIDRGVSYTNVSVLNSRFLISPNNDIDRWLDMKLDDDPGNTAIDMLLAMPDLDFNI